MKRTLFVFLAVAACDKQQTPENPAQSSSTLALSSDDALLYAVDTDNALLAVIDTRTDEKVAEVKVGNGAARVAVGLDDRVYVANRFDASVSVVRRGEWAEAARWKAGVEPVSLQVAADGKTLYVLSAVAEDTASHGTLYALDTETGAQRWSLAVGPEPRGVALVGDSHAAVTLLKEGDIQLVDLATPSVVVAKTDTYERMNKTSLDLSQQNGAQVDFQHARAVSAIATSPDGTHVHALGITARSGPQNAWGGCAGTLLAAPAMFSFDPDGTSYADDVFSCQATDNTVPRTVMIPPGQSLFGGGDNPNLIQGPSAIALERSGRWMYVAHESSNNVALISTVSEGKGDIFSGSGTVDAVVKVGRGPNGIAVRRDGARAYVLNALDHTVSVLGDDGNHGVAKLKDIGIATDVLPADVVAGRKLFFDATDSRMTGNTLGAACATCHIDNGQEDGHTWTFAEGTRQTMSLAGRLSGTAPFHWDGTLENIDVLMQHTTTERMGGKGTTAVMAAQVSAYLGSLPRALNPRQSRPLNDVEKRGLAVFQKAQCGTCHSGASLTNNGFAHVGTFEGGGSGITFTGTPAPTFPADGVNTPSLLGLARTAPYLHDGSAATLVDRITIGKASDMHGKTASLSDGEVEDLVEYLQTL